MQNKKPGAANASGFFVCLSIFVSRKHGRYERAEETTPPAAVVDTDKIGTFAPWMKSFWKLRDIECVWVQA